ncbi:MAG: hypothetical protein JWR89_3334, partial [Tardiphaga sp.]|nr:hypothetical protein [Tardiphaga sp.]
IEIERLGDHLHAGLQKTFRDRGTFGIAGDEQDLEFRPRLAGLVGELAAVHTG